MNKLIGTFALVGLLGYSILLFLLVGFFGVRVLFHWDVLSIALAFVIPAAIGFGSTQLSKGAAFLATACFGYLVYRGCAGAITHLALGNLMLGIGTIGGLGTSVLALLATPSSNAK